LKLPDLSNLPKVLILISVGAFLPSTLLAQPDRIGGSIDARRLVELRGNIHPLAKPQFDAGAVDPSLQLNYITLMVKPSASQQAELDQLLIEQQDPRSPNFRNWLSPEQYADRFGASPADIAKITGWLRSEGLEIITVARGRRWIAFNATAQQVQRTFHTEIHNFRAGGELHFANATEPSVPAAIEPMVLGIQGLDNFYPKPRKRASALPEATNSTGGHVLGPDDIAIIYDITKLYNAGINGTGVSIAIVGGSQIPLSDVRQFRSTFGLPTDPPTFMLVPGSTDPGFASSWQGENTIDTQWVGAVARNANVLFVYSNNVYTSLTYIIDQDLAPVISVSVGQCEPNLGSNIQGLGADAQQAAAQGQTELVSSGDWGADTCDFSDFSGTPTKNPASVNGWASPPEVTAVGGTTFDEGNGKYWGPYPGNANQATALGYIPEKGWSQSGGGYSSVYSRGAWQVGALPPGNARGVPDVALSSDEGHDYYYWVSNGAQVGVGGTSVAAPVFAGMVVLLNQYLGTNGLGNINPNMYRIAKSPNSAFHDITTGGNFTPCVPGSSTDCPAGRTSYGYSAGPGWDPVTGLGSVDAYNLVHVWTSGEIGTTTGVTANPVNVSLSGQTQFTATVTANSNVTPTGSVAFTLGNTSLGTATLFGSGSKATATLSVSGGQLTAGSETILATYGGDSNVNGSTGSVTITVSVPASNSAVIPSIVPDPVYQQQQPDANGNSWFYTIRLAEVAGVATTLTGFSIDGTDYSTQINDLFETSAIPANGTLATELADGGFSVPITRAFVFSGMDASGRTWTQTINVPFYGPQTSASMVLTSVPATVVQNPGASANCQWFQNLLLQEQTGHAVQITKVLAGGYDLSSNILTYFPSTRLPALGYLIGSICWSGVAVPTNYSYEIDGVDDGGNQVFITASVPFQGPVNNPGALSVSSGTVPLSIPDSSQSTNAQVSVNVPAGQQWTVSVFPSNQTTNWLTLYPPSGTGPATVTVSASGVGGALDDGLYQATLAFQSTNTLPPSVLVQVNFVVGQPNVTSIVNGASFVDTGLSPGLIFTLKGTGLGPISPQGVQLDSNGNVASNVDGVQVLVGGTAAPLLYVQAAQINAVVPYEIAGKVGQQVNVQVMNNGAAGNMGSANVVTTAPAIFSLGNNQGAILNQDASVNGPGNPAAVGSVIQIYATGEGQLRPSGVDGQIATQTLANLPRPVAPFSLTIGGKPATYTYAGTAPQSFEGFFQVDAVIPAGVPSGSAPVILMVGGVPSPPLNVVVK
jgi:uncharacterized protein (TIGR03437 family)